MKQTKITPKIKKEKPKKIKESKSSSSKIKVKDDNSNKSLKANLHNNIINISTNLSGMKGANKSLSTSLNDNDFNKLSFSKEGQESQNGIRNTIVPVKPIPKRYNGSNLDFLSNACKMTDFTKLLPLSQKSDENMKKREDKALDKSLHNILSNSEIPF